MSDLPTSRGRWSKPECRHTEGEHHDCQAVDHRNRHISRAWAEANQSVPAIDPGRDARVTRAFFEAMNRICGTPNAPRPEPTNGVSNHRRYVA